MSEIIQMENTNFHEIMCVLRDVALEMARNPLTKIDDERWVLFVRVAAIVHKYDAQFQPDEPATDPPRT
jgi:hypothetical protein